MKTQQQTSGNNHNNNSTSSSSSLEEYLWETANIGGFSEANNNKVRMFLPGIMSLINHHPILENVIPSGLTKDNDDENDSNATASIMAGSYSSYHNLQMIATSFIPAGQELFLNYNGMAHHPLLSSLSSHLLNNGPITQDYQKAEQIVNGLWELHLKQKQKQQQPFTSAQWVDVLYRIRTEILGEERREQISSLLPKTFDELVSAYTKGIAQYRLLDGPEIPSSTILLLLIKNLVVVCKSIV